METQFNHEESFTGLQRLSAPQEDVYAAELQRGLAEEIDVFNMGQSDQLLAGKSRKRAGRRKAKAPARISSPLHDAFFMEDGEDMFKAMDGSSWAVASAFTALGAEPESPSAQASRRPGLDDAHCLRDDADRGAGQGKTSQGSGDRPDSNDEKPSLWNAVRSLTKLNKENGCFDFGGRPRKGGIWPSPFPGYKGLFTYEVKENERETDASLGNGVYLWMLEILSGTVQIGVHDEDDPDIHIVPFGCQMKKTLVSYPEDACDAMKACLDKYVIENWTGKAEVECKVFVLETIGPEVVETTIQWQGLPLPREALAGVFEMELAPDDSVVKAVHVSWMQFANLSADEASGFMFRINEGSPICPTLRPPVLDELDRKLHEAVELLHGSRVFQRGEAHRVRYWPTIFRITDISTTAGTFEAELEIAMDYLVSRDDVFEYIIRPAGWKPRWHPKTFEPINAQHIDAVRTQIYPPTLKVLEGGSGQQKELRAEILISYRGTFEERFELQSFPFDVQPLHVKLEAEQEPGVQMVRLPQDDNMGARLSNKWGISEWKFLDYKVAHAHSQGGHAQGLSARFFVACRVRRHARSYLIRIVAFVGLICLLSLCIFVIDATQDLPDMIGHSFMMMLTLTTYSLVVGDILPNLGYLTMLDQIILISFFFLAIIVLQIAWLGWAQERQADSMDADDIKGYSNMFAKCDLLGVGLIILIIVLYVKFFVDWKELRKLYSSPGEELDDAMGQTTKTQVTGRFSVSGVNTALKQ